MYVAVFQYILLAEAHERIFYSRHGIAGHAAYSS